MFCFLFVFSAELVEVTKSLAREIASSSDIRQRMGIDPIPDRQPIHRAVALGQYMESAAASIPDVMWLDFQEAMVRESTSWQRKAEEYHQNEANRQREEEERQQQRPQFRMKQVITINFFWLVGWLVGSKLKKIVHVILFLFVCILTGEGEEIKDRITQQYSNSNATANAPAADAPAADTTPADTTPADSTAADTTPADSTAADTTAADNTAADTTAADGTPGHIRVTHTTTSGSLVPANIQASTELHTGLHSGPDRRNTGNYLELF